MSVRKRPSKKAKSGYTYQVYFPYVNAFGERCIYRKGGFKDKKSAVEFENRKKNEITNYGMLYVDTGTTVDQAFKEAMEIARSSYALATYTYYCDTYKNHIQKYFGKRKVASLTYRELHSRINAKENSYATAKNIKKVLILIYKYSLRQGLVKENLVKLTDVEIRNTENKEARNLKEEQIELVINELSKSQKNTPKWFDPEWINQNYTIAIQIGRYTGLRVSEVMALEKSDFDMENNTISVNKRLEYHGLKKEELYTVEMLKTKSSKAVIPLVSPLKTVLQQWFDITPFNRVITDANGNYIHPTTMNSRFQLIGHKLGFRFTFHMLRHFYSSYLYEHNVDPEMRKNLLRHSQLEMTSSYTHTDIRQKQIAAERAFGDSDDENH